MTGTQAPRNWGQTAAKVSWLAPLLTILVNQILRMNLQPDQVAILAYFGLGMI